MLPIIQKMTTREQARRYLNKRIANLKTANNIVFYDSESIEKLASLLEIIPERYILIDQPFEMIYFYYKGIRVFTLIEI